MRRHLGGFTVGIAAAIVSLASSGTAVAYPNIYERLEIGECALYDRTNQVGGPADCDSVQANYRLVEKYQLAPETAGMECGDPMAAVSYHHRTDDGVRLALYCFANNFRVGDCWNFTDVRERRRVDCDAHEPETSRLTAVYEGVSNAARCHDQNTDAVVWDKPRLTVCTTPG
ncbi:hypothetical protein [Nocardia sp. bgisy118]|uniref:hypothetical protein n=1 Tax=Nocardia sp. bgisy118 TaxID=3413786 RepID=UPI003F4A82B1